MVLPASNEFPDIREAARVRDKCVKNMELDGLHRPDPEVCYDKSTMRQKVAANIAFGGREEMGSSKFATREKASVAANVHNDSCRTDAVSGGMEMVPPAESRTIVNMNRHRRTTGGVWLATNTKQPSASRMNFSWDEKSGEACDSRQLCTPHTVQAQKSSSIPASEEVDTSLCPRSPWVSGSGPRRPWRRGSGRSTNTSWGRPPAGDLRTSLKSRRQSVPIAETEEKHCLESGIRAEKTLTRGMASTPNAPRKVPMSQQAYNWNRHSWTASDYGPCLGEGGAIYCESFGSLDPARNESLPYFIANGFVWKSDIEALGITTGTLVVGAKVEDPNALLSSNQTSSPAHTSPMQTSYVSNSKFMQDLMDMAKWIWADPKGRLIPAVSERYED